MLDHSTLVRNAYQLQPLPPTLARLSALMTEEMPCLDEMTEIISFDPVITAKLLRVANSSFSAPCRAVTQVKEAVVRLGPGIVFSLAIGSCARPLMEQTVPGYGLYAGELWRHSVMAALAAEASRRFCHVAIPIASFTAALLHDLGKLVLGQSLTSENRTLLRRAVEEGGIEPFEAEVEVLSVHHGEVGGVIAQHWQLPESIIQGITCHHDPDKTEETIGFVTHLADMVARTVSAGTTPLVADNRRIAGTCEFLGLTNKDFERLCTQVGEDFQKMIVRYY